MMRAVFRYGLILLMASGSLVAPAFAAPKVTETIQTYAVDGVTSLQLRRQMRERGPKRFWALTRWDVRWSVACDVRVHIVYTVPQHERPSRMPPDVRARFDLMLANLMAHERQHGAHGIAAAREIAQAKCRDAAAIIQKYAAADRKFDRQTGHGRKTGVRLD